MDENNLQKKRSPDGEENGRPGFSVLREGRKLQDMTMEQLRDRFEMLFGEAPAQHLTALHLTKRILWRLQEIRYGGLTAKSEMFTHETLYDEMSKRLLRHLKAKGRVTHGDLLRASHLDKDTFKTVVATMAEAGQIREEVAKVGRTGQVQRTYVFETE